MYICGDERRTHRRVGVTKQPRLLRLFPGEQPQNDDHLSSQRRGIPRCFYVVRRATLENEHTRVRRKSMRAREQCRGNLTGPTGVSGRGIVAVLWAPSAGGPGVLTQGKRRTFHWTSLIGVFPSLSLCAFPLGSSPSSRTPKQACEVYWEL